MISRTPPTYPELTNVTANVAMAWIKVIIHFFQPGNVMARCASSGRKSTTNGDSAVPCPGYGKWRTSSLRPAWLKTTAKYAFLFLNFWLSTSWTDTSVDEEADDVDAGLVEDMVGNIDETLFSACY